MKKYLVILLLMLCVLPVNAQIDDTSTPITLSNSFDLTLMAMLQIDNSIDGVRTFPNLDIEWSSNGNWFGIGYNTMLYVYDANRLQNSPLEFDISFDYSDNCGSNPFYVEVRDIAFHPTQDIVVVTNPSRLYVYDLQTETEIGMLDNLLTDDIAFMDDGSLLIVAMDGSFSLLDIETMTVSTVDEIDIASFTIIDPASVEIGTDGRIYFTDGFDVHEHDGLTSEELRTFAAPTCELPSGGSGDCANTPVDLDMLAVSGNTVAAVDSGLCTTQDINVWNMSDTQIMSELPTESRFIALSSDGSIIATDGEDDFGMTTLYDTQTGDPITTLPRTMATFDAEFSSDGSILATISQSGLVQLWTLPENLSSREELLSLSTVNIDYACDGVQTIDEGATINIGWSWYARTIEQIYDHIENANYTILVNDNTPQRWIFLSQPEQYQPHGTDTWTVFYYMPIGAEIPGAHLVSYTLNWVNPISDGFLTYGTGERETLSGVCNYFVGEY